eukprot:TRINITY_DN10697_c0_g1_i2.p1 TRINITY_DN10697_c0_g1~~TRINITY_DN10697_c0_g1_i2.p1  ORF type:complete len:232 (+),score=41.21 TRINITY_DN10697_c0_g1_i2:28-723(+)
MATRYHHEAFEMPYSLKTPDYAHLTLKDWECIYEPAEDTFLLLDALELHAEELIAQRPSICAEIGCGPGLAITALGTILKDHDIATDLHVTDINAKALAAAQETAQRNGLNLITHQCDLATDLLDLQAKIDVLLFNPPYVVTPPDEVTDDGCLQAAWAGGKDGREVTDRLLPLIPDLLSDRGRFYLIAIKENLLEGTDRDLYRAIPGFLGRQVNQRRAGPERLSVICYQRV